MKTMTITLTLIPAPEDGKAIADVMFEVANTFEYALKHWVGPGFPTLMALRSDDGMLLGGASIAVGDMDDKATK
jgi:hypothetical protein